MPSAKPMSELLGEGREGQSFSFPGSPTAFDSAFISGHSESAVSVQDNRREDLRQSQTLARVCQGQVPREMAGSDPVLYDFLRLKCEESVEDQGRACALEAARACRPGVWLLKTRR